MVDSDIDKWYDLKRETDFFETSRIKNLSETSGDIYFFGSNLLDNSKPVQNDPKETALYNGSTRYKAVPTSSRSSKEIRFINPAIYAESMEKQDQDREIDSRDKVDDNKYNDCINRNCGDSTEINDLISTLAIQNGFTENVVDHAGDQVSSQDTHRCYSITSPVASSSESTIVCPKSPASTRPFVPRIERRCRIEEETNKGDLRSARQLEPEVQRYELNGQRVVQISTTSLSSTNISEGKLNGIDYNRRVAHEEWIRKKQQAAKLKKEEEDLGEKKKQAETDRLAREKEEKEYRERQNFLMWTERKKKEEEMQRALIDKELEFQKRLKEIEDKTGVAKALYLRQWNRKKKEEEKARQKKLELKQKQIDEEKKKRLEDSSKAYEKWRVSSKKIPKPATQGLLPHQKAKPAYVNPIPWQPIVEHSDNVQEDTSNSKKISKKMGNKKNALSQQ